jgi:hypothetical protein
MVSTAQIELLFCPWCLVLLYCLKNKNIYTDTSVNNDRLANGDVIDMGLLAAAVCSFVQHTFCYNQVKLTFLKHLKCGLALRESSVL